MAEPQPGFTVHGKFYPLVSIDDWRHEDWRLARRLTDLGPMEIASPDADELLVKTGAAAVAFLRENTDLGIDKVHKFFDALKPSDIEPVGFEAEQEAPKDVAAPSPPSETPSDSSSSSTEKSTDASPETSAPTGSGTTGPDTGSQVSHLG